MEIKYHDYIIPGLDVLIGDPTILCPPKTGKKRAKIFFIPEGYIKTVIDFYNEQSSRGDACKELTRLFGAILNEIKVSNKNSFILENDTSVEFIKPDEETFTKNGLSKTSSKDQAIATAKWLSKCRLSTEKHLIAIMTGSDQLSTLASYHRIDVAHLNPEVYTGRRQVELPFELSNLWYSNHKITANEWKEFFPNEMPLRPNEFVEFRIDSYGQTGNFENIGRFDIDKNALIPLSYFSFTRPEFKKIRPRNAGQAMLLEALLMPPDKIPLVIVSGVFGTGKTFLTTAAAYHGVETNTYEKIFVCPRDGALGKEIGFVPGDATEKTRVKAKPIADNLREVLRLIGPQKKAKFTSEETSLNESRTCLDKRIAELLDEIFEYDSIINMGGRSISNNFIIFDEFQDMERYQAKALLSRIGNNSKIVVSGDPTQVTNPHLNLTSNGLSYSASKLAGKPEAIIVTLTSDEIVRSSAAKAISDYFD